MRIDFDLTEYPQTHRHTDRQPDIQTDRHTDKLTDRQTGPISGLSPPPSNQRAPAARCRAVARDQ